jgi:hypothetical protein
MSYAAVLLAFAWGCNAGMEQEWWFYALCVPICCVMAHISKE